MVGGPYHGNSYIIPDTNSEHRISHPMRGGTVEHVYARTGNREFTYRETIGVFEFDLAGTAEGVKLGEAVNVEDQR